MVLFFDDPTFITSDKTPEVAFRTTTSSWTVSWLEDRELTFEQARAAMILDEMLSDPTAADDPFALEVAALHAGELELTLPEVVLRLALRMAERELHRNRKPRRADRGDRKFQGGKPCMPTPPNDVSAAAGPI